MEKHLSSTFNSLIHNFLHANSKSKLAFVEKYICKTGDKMSFNYKNAKNALFLITGFLLVIASIIPKGIWSYFNDAENIPNTLAVGICRLEVNSNLEFTLSNMYPDESDTQPLHINVKNNGSFFINHLFIDTHLDTSNFQDKGGNNFSSNVTEDKDEKVIMSPNPSADEKANENVKDTDNDNGTGSNTESGKENSNSNKNTKGNNDKNKDDNQSDNGKNNKYKNKETAAERFASQFKVEFLLNNQVLNNDSWTLAELANHSPDIATWLPNNGLNAGEELDITVRITFIEDLNPGQQKQFEDNSLPVEFVLEGICGNGGSDDGGDDDDDGGGDGNWDKSSLKFTSSYGNNSTGIFATIQNGAGSEDMDGPSKYEVYWIASGNPKDGTIEASGTIPALASGASETLTFNTTKPGVYKFKAYQRNGHPGKGVLWSGSIEVD